MTEKEMIEAEKYWCEKCCNFDREHIRIDGFAKCRFTNTLAYAEECGRDCKAFNKPADNILVLPCKVGDWVYEICFGKLSGQKVVKQSKVTAIKITDKLTITLDYTTNLCDADIGRWLFIGKNAKAEAEQALRKEDEGK